MSVTSEIERIKTNISNAYTELENKKATIPTLKNSNNLATTISSIPSGGGSSFEINDVAYLFYKGARKDYVNEWVSLISPNCTKYSYMFYESTLTDIPLFNTSAGNYFDYMFYFCSYLAELKQYDTSNGQYFEQMCRSCSRLETIDELDFSKAVRLTQMFSGCTKLTNLGGFKNLGKAYSTSSSANYSQHTLDLSSCPSLTHDSLMNVINNLYDIASKGCRTQALKLGSTNLAKLTEEEIAIATNKGWTVS